MRNQETILARNNERDLKGLAHLSPKFLCGRKLSAQSTRKLVLAVAEPNATALPQGSGKGAQG